MTLTGLEQKVIGHEVTVLFCGVKLAEFNEISNDYAYTCAADFRKHFTYEWFKEGNDRLQMDQRVEKCKNYAYSNL